MTIADLTAQSFVASVARSLTHVEVRSLPCSLSPRPGRAISAIGAADV
jgi:hypothetical protein